MHSKAAHTLQFITNIVSERAPGFCALHLAAALPNPREVLSTSRFVMLFSCLGCKSKCRSVFVSRTLQPDRKRCQGARAKLTWGWLKSYPFFVESL